MAWKLCRIHRRQRFFLFSDTGSQFQPASKWKNETVEIKKVVSERYPVEYFPDFVCFGGRQYGVKTHDNVDILLQNAKESIHIKRCNVLNDNK